MQLARKASAQRRKIRACRRHPQDTRPVARNSTPTRSRAFGQARVLCVPAEPKIALLPLVFERS
jgi:hypothetical protein